MELASHDSQQQKLKQTNKKNPYIQTQLVDYSWK